jgi:uncharacterized protein (TIGR02646 family)
MRRINRDGVPVPECLEEIEDGWTYRDLRGAEKEQIRTALIEVQGQRCAYCERRTGADAKDGHVEHFRKQADHNDMTLTWDNLFWSCNDENSCGKFKDSCSRVSGPRAKFDPTKLIDPSVDDPDDFLLFVTDGTVRPKDGLTDEQCNRAQESLRVFNLADYAFLRKAREDAVRPFVRTIAYLQEHAPGAVAAYVASEQEKIDSQPFSAAIKSFFRAYL